MKKNEYKKAFATYRRIILESNADPKLVGQDFRQAVICLLESDEQEKIDQFRELAVKRHAQNWRLLLSAAEACVFDQYIDSESEEDIPDYSQYGALQAGVFIRNEYDDSGNEVISVKRDRARALQLMVQAMKLIEDEKDHKSKAFFFLQFAKLFQNRQDSQSLAELTDISKLPNYDSEESGAYYSYKNSAAIDKQGNPIFHEIPQSFIAAKSDGERWRWALAQAVKYNPKNEAETQKMIADFSSGEFGLSKLAHYTDLDNKKINIEKNSQNKKNNPLAFHVFKDNETTLFINNELTRVTLKEEYNFIKIYRQLAKLNIKSISEDALESLIWHFECRRQFPKAAICLKESIQRFDDHENKWKQKNLDSILGNRGAFKLPRPQIAGQNVKLSFGFRNAKQVNFQAYQLDVDGLIADLASLDKPFDSEKDHRKKIDPENIRHGLNELKIASKYRGKKVASWSVALKPLAKHFDKEIEIATPLKQVGGYLIEGQIVDGNKFHTILWIEETAMVSRKLGDKCLIYITDAKTGKPLANTEVNIVEYDSKAKKKPYCKSFLTKTNKQGQIRLNYEEAERASYLTLKQNGSKSSFISNLDLDLPSERFSTFDDREAMPTEYTITDRPIYRPGQTVKLKTWLRILKNLNGKYKTPANARVRLDIFKPSSSLDTFGGRFSDDPVIFSKDIRLDKNGSLWAEFKLPKDAPLGRYDIKIEFLNKKWKSVGGLGNIGGFATDSKSFFHVEEYKKPEYEVSIEMPQKPVALGEPIIAKIKSNYYYGKPVANAKVKYRVYATQSSHKVFPTATWDWLYGRGYAYFGKNDVKPEAYNPSNEYDYFHANKPHEPLFEKEGALDSNGNLEVKIDTLGFANDRTKDYRYDIAVAVTDQSRRIVRGTGSVLVNRHPFNLTAVIDRGFGYANQEIELTLNAQTLNNIGVAGEGHISLQRIHFDKVNRKQLTEEVDKWKIETNNKGVAVLKFKVKEVGQYRIVTKLIDRKMNSRSSEYEFNIIDKNFDTTDFEFKPLELIVEKKQYKPGEKVKLLINTNQENSTVLLLIRPEDDDRTTAKVINIKGKSTVFEIKVLKSEAAKFFVEAITISQGKIHTIVQEILVPPKKTILNIDIKPASLKLEPGENTTLKLKITDSNGKPFIGTAAVTVYDKSLEYFAKDNLKDIKKHWGYVPEFNSQDESYRDWQESYYYDLYNYDLLGHYGSFRDRIVITGGSGGGGGFGGGDSSGGLFDGLSGFGIGGCGLACVSEDLIRNSIFIRQRSSDLKTGNQTQPEVLVRKNFSDSAFWSATVETNQQGIAELEFPLPHNLTTWKVKVWAMNHKTKVGYAETELVTSQDFLLRMQAPRFFVETDEVLLSANVHNYLPKKKQARVALKLHGKELTPLSGLIQTVQVDGSGQARVNWRVKVKRAGMTTISMTANADNEADAVSMSFPVHVHGMNKIETWAGSLSEDQQKVKFSLTVPKKRRPEQSKLEIIYSPTLANTLIEALPYLLEYPHGCTEQTMNRFVPLVVTQSLLKKKKIDLAAIVNHRTKQNSKNKLNLHNSKPVFSSQEVTQLSKVGVKRLSSMQLRDGGWNWFGDFQGKSDPHATAVVLYGLQMAMDSGLDVNPKVIEKAVDWLDDYQSGGRSAFGPIDEEPKKEISNINALIYLVLSNTERDQTEIRDRLFRDRKNLSVYGKVLFALGLHKSKEKKKLKQVLAEIKKHLVVDNENDTAYLKLPTEDDDRNWHGNVNEANAFYLKLLTKIKPKQKITGQLVRYILKQRKQNGRWDSTRDTAYNIQAIAEYLQVSDEGTPDFQVDIFLDGKQISSKKINSQNVFLSDYVIEVQGITLTAGKHEVEIRRTGKGPLYINSSLSVFTKEDHITASGTGVKLDRKYYRTIKIPPANDSQNKKGKPIYKRVEVKNLTSIKSGEILDVELTLISKNECEYVLLQDMKPAGFETMKSHSGYIYDRIAAYMEIRDDQVNYFIRELPQGKQKFTYRIIAEIPGKFSALPARLEAMYSPQIRSNSNEMKFIVKEVD